MVVDWGLGLLPDDMTGGASSYVFHPSPWVTGGAAEI
jgi:hypothetical protein